MKKLKNSIIYLLCMVMMLGIVEPMQAQAATTDTTSEEEIEDKGLTFTTADLVKNVKCKITKNKKSNKDSNAYIYTYTWKVNKSSPMYKTLQSYKIYDHAKITFDGLDYTKYEDTGVPIKKEKIVVKNYAPGIGGTFNTRFRIDTDIQYYFEELEAKYPDALRNGIHFDEGDDDWHYHFLQKPNMNAKVDFIVRPQKNHKFEIETFLSRDASSPNFTNTCTGIQIEYKLGNKTYKKTVKNPYSGSLVGIPTVYTKKLKANKTYTFRIRMYQTYYDKNGKKKTAYGPWSKKGKVKNKYFFGDGIGVYNYR